MLEFGEFLKKELKRNKLSQRQLAKKVGVQPTYISKIIRGEQNTPSSELIYKMSEVLGFAPDVLCFKYGKIPQNIKDKLKKYTIESCEFFRGLD